MSMTLLFDKDFLVTLVVGIMAFATVVTIGVPLSGARRPGRPPEVGGRAGARNCAPAIMPRSTPSAVRLRVEPSHAT